MGELRGVFHPVFSLVWPIQHPQRPKSCPSTWAFRPVTFPSHSSAESQPVGLPFKVSPLSPAPSDKPLPHTADTPPAPPPYYRTGWTPRPLSFCLFLWIMVFVFLFFFGFVILFLSVMWCFIFFMCTMMRETKHWAPNCCTSLSGWPPSLSLSGPYQGEGHQEGQHKDGEGTVGLKWGLLKLGRNYLRCGICWKPGCSSSCFRTV